MKTNLRLARLAALFLGVSMVACGDPARDTEASAASTTADALSSNGVTADLALQSDWGSGYCAGVTLANTGSAGVTSWTVVVEMNGSTLSQLWSGSYTQAGTQVTVKPLSWNSTISPSGSVSFGFCGNGSGRPSLASLTVTGGSPTTTSYTLAIATSGNGSTNPAAGTYTYPAGTAVKVTATPSTGATFTGWSGAATGTVNPVTITVDANKALTATFSGGNTTCQKGATKGSEVAVIGESFIAMTHGITQEIEKQAKAAGSLEQNDHYVDNSVSGTTLANNQIPSQYTQAVQSSGTIKYVLMDGGGNDCLLNNNGDAAFTAAQALFQTMAQNKTEKVVYFFYPDPIGSNFASLKTCLDALRPRMKSLCDGLTAPRCYWLDLRPIWSGHPEYTSDGIHPTSAGSTVTGDAIWQVMKTNCVAQ